MRIFSRYADAKFFRPMVGYGRVRTWWAGFHNSNVRKEETESDLLYLVFDSLDWILLFSERGSQKPRYPEQKVLWLLVKHSGDTVHFFWYRQGKSSFMLKGICDRLRYLKQYLLGRGHVLWAAQLLHTKDTDCKFYGIVPRENPRQLDDSECVRIVWNYIKLTIIN